ncbi:leucine zipper domain-containing protein [Acidiphilium sp. PA]|uniref:leucine zipper domain-containing protein n=1 Tax=Acidiphilium sp. PA TaxID=2871705 RepID=UPI002242E0B4|nr:leucine zipper domain-containing protein [Acidiphilium sp. PA]MCW8309449.1 leucine zipper domain-containing protein [Acidiphilium sp. PA]
MALDQEQTVDVQDDCWQTAQARSDVFRRLLTVSDARERSRFIAHAIKELSISRATFYRLLARFRTAEVNVSGAPRASRAQKRVAFP